MESVMAVVTGLFAAIFAIAAVAQSASAADIKILTAGAMRGVLIELVPQFEKDTGHKVTLDNATAGTLAKRIEDGEAFDVAVITPKVIDDLAKKGRIAPESRMDVAKVGIGVAVKDGAPLPDIASVDAFKRMLLGARSVAYIDPKSGGSSGIYFDNLLDRLGIAGEIRPKARLKQGGYVAELVASGEAEVAVHQISEIVPVKGVVLVGPLPAEIQNFTTYTAAIGTQANDTAAAKALIDRLTTSIFARAVMKLKGMEKP
jgi:molybdate transport system substrate-binding protein